MLHLEILDDQRRELLGEVSEMIKDYNFYMAGGTALSLQRGYRTSVDFNFFSKVPFDQNQVYYLFKQHGFDQCTSLQLTRGTCDLSVNGVQVSMFYYPYKVFKRVSGAPEYPNLQMAGMKDITCMKLSAISQRGAKKDFYDLYEIMKDEKYSPDAIIDMLCSKYSLSESGLSNITMGLSYFEDAEPQQLHELFRNDDWNMIKQASAKLAEDIEKCCYFRFRDNDELER